MYHDFIDPFTSPKTVYRDSNGVSCTDDHGVMDYFVTVQKWSTCSVERFTQHYNNVVARDGKFCLALAGDGTTLSNKPSFSGSKNIVKNYNVLKCAIWLFLANGNWGPWSFWGSCSKSCESGVQTRTRLCNDPVPANGGANCAGSGTESKTCNTFSCAGGKVLKPLRLNCCYKEFRDYF